MKSRIMTAVALLACATVGCVGCGKKAKEGVKWLTSMEEGKAEASAEGKHLVVYYSADWSKMSEQFEDDVLDNAEVQKKLAGLVAVHIDADVDEETPKNYGVNAYPTTIFYTPEGEEVTRAVGAVEAEKFLSLVDDILAGRVETLKELLAREGANPDDLDLAYEVGTMYVETGRVEKARSRFEKIVAQDPENETGHLPGALMQLGFIELMAQQAEEAITVFNRVIEEYPDSAEARKCLLYVGDANHLRDDVDEAVAVYRKVVETYPDTPEAAEAQKKISKLTMFEETVEAFTQGPETAEAGETK
ncbi:MAG TPA: tetratricopeptide repeat protein [bacterium]|nr:tetratricopeptide repeat protein [bacterium]